MRRIVAIGGGHGLAQILRGLKLLHDVVITGICGNTDSGGKTKKAIAEYGAASYLGDLTRLVAALCPDERLAAALDYRFQDGSLEGWTLRHVMLLALEKMNPEHLDEALELMCRHCDVGLHRVMPMTRDRVSLRTRYVQVGSPNQLNFLDLEEEAQLDAISQNPLWPALDVKKISLSSFAAITPRADRAIREADCIVIAPGSFYGSIIATLLPNGVIEAFAQSQAKIVFLLNICRTEGETYHYEAGDFVRRVEATIGKPVSYIMCDHTKIGRKLARCGCERISWEKFYREEIEIGPVCRIWEASLASTKDGQFLHDPVLVAEAFRHLFVEMEDTAGAEIKEKLFVAAGIATGA